MLRKLHVKPSVIQEAGNLKFLNAHARSHCISLYDTEPTIMAGFDMEYAYAVTAVKLGLVSSKSLENVAKRASILAIESETPVGNTKREEGEQGPLSSNQVWQPFPSKSGDPATHALMWRKVTLRKLPHLQPLPGSEKRHNFTIGERFMQFDGGLYRVLNATGRSSFSSSSVHAYVHVHIV